jgi:Fatty acid desaturase
MNAMLQLLPLAAALATSALLMAHLKTKASSGLLHHATHGRLFADAQLNRWAGEAVGILTLSLGFDEYRRVHGQHHGYGSFAQAGLDEEADSLIAEGFTPGRSQRALWWLFWSKPINPLWHARQAWGRLQSNFFGGPLLRRSAAWAVWGGAGAVAASTGWLPGFLGAVGLLLVAGSIGSYLELVSRHVWAVTPPEMGRARQLALSHWRLPAPQVPALWTLRSTLRFAGSVLLKALWRFAATPLDLPHHPAHHLAWDAHPHGAPPLWTDAALAHSERLRSEPALHAQAHGSLLGAVGAWFKALEAAAPLLNHKPQ